MNPILIHKGDCTIFADVKRFLTFNIETNLNLTGWKAKFILGWITKEIEDISSKSFEIVLSSEDTKQLKIGTQHGSIILTDAEGHIKTLANNIPFEVTTAVVENEYQEIDLTIPQSSGVDIKLRVGSQGGGGAVNSVNGMTGDVVIDIPSLDGYVKDTDYASSTKAGVFKTDNGLTVTSKGVIAGTETSLENYEKRSYYLVMSKGTLENIKNDLVKRAVTENDIELTEEEKASAKNWLGYADSTDIMQAIASIPQFKLSIVNELPSTGAKMTLYLVPKEGTNNDVYDEYIWIEQTSSFEHLGTTAVDLTDYVKNTDYGTTAKAGVIKAYSQNGFGINNSGQPYGNSASLSTYKSAGGNYFISKGTLENIKYDLVKDGVVNSNVSLGDSDKEKVRNWIGASAEVIQQSSFEFLPADRNANRICQYIGETNKEFTNGYFYKSVVVYERYSTNNSDIVTFDFDSFWSELNTVGITKESLRLTDEMYTRGGFRIIGTPISETQIRITSINGFSVDVVLNNTVIISQKLLSVGGETSFSYYKEYVYSWIQHNTQPSAKTLLITEADYNALETKDSNTLYLIEE